MFRQAVDNSPCFETPAARGAMQQIIDFSWNLKKPVLAVFGDNAVGKEVAYGAGKMGLLTKKLGGDTELDQFRKASVNGMKVYTRGCWFDHFKDLKEHSGYAALVSPENFEATDLTAIDLSEVVLVAEEAGALHRVPDWMYKPQPENTAAAPEPVAELVK